jgi:hypothetical protein
MMGFWITPVYIFWRISLTETFAGSFGLVIWLVLFFTLLLSAGLKLFTVAKRHEILGGAAA